MFRILRHIIIMTLLLSAAAGPSFGAVNQIEEEDGAPSQFPWKVKFPNGSLTNNGDGTASVDFIGGSLPTTYLKLDQSTPQTTSGTFTFPTVNFGSTTGVSATATNGVLTLTSLFGQAENLTVDGAGTANTIVLNSGTGATSIVSNLGLTLQTNKALTITSNVADTELLKFNTDRPWSFWQRSTAGGTILDLRGTGSEKFFQITNAAGTRIIDFQATAGDLDVVSINSDSVACNFRVKGDTDSSLLFTDGSTDRVGIGIATPGTKFEVFLGDATTNTSSEVMRISHSGGAISSGFGSQLKFFLESSTESTMRTASQIETLWTDATDATRTSAIKLSTVTSGGALTEFAHFGGTTVKLFDQITVGDTTDGNSFYVYRKAAEGTKYFRVYVNQFMQGKLASDCDTWDLEPSSGGVVRFRYNGSIGANGGLYNSILYHYGKITAAGPADKYVFWKVNDDDDYFHLTREDTNILGFKVDMPMQVNLEDTTTNSVTEVARIQHSGGAIANGFGSGLDFYLEDATAGTIQQASRIGTLWTDATDASRTSAITFSGVTNGGALTEWGRIYGASAGTGGCLQLDVSGQASTHVVGLSLQNTTVTTSGATTQHSPLLSFRAKYWEGTENRYMDWAIEGFSQPAGDRADLYFYYRNNTSTWTKFPINFTGSGYAECKPGTGIGESEITGWAFLTDSSATVGGDQNSLLMTFLGRGWKTDATAASQAMTVGIWNAPEQGTASPIGVLKFSFGTNSSSITESNELARLEWGDRLGTIFNDQSLNGYVFRVEGDTDVNLLNVNGTADQVCIGTSTGTTGAKLTVAGYTRASTATYRRYYHIPMSSVDPGASGATWTAAAATNLAGWQLNAVGETLNFDSDVHADWDGASDLSVEIYWQILTAGSAADTVDLRLIASYMAVGDTAIKTQTVEVATVTDGTQYKMYKTTFTINWDEVSNVVEVGDKMTFLLNLETDTSEIDNILVIGGSITYNTTHVGIENGDI